MIKFYGGIDDNRLNYLLNKYNVLNIKQMEILKKIQTIDHYSGFHIVSELPEFYFEEFKVNDILLHMATCAGGAADEVHRLDANRAMTDSEFKKSSEEITVIVNAILHFLNDYMKGSVEQNIELIGYDDEWIQSL